jgi:hypothetical protein
LDAHEGGIPGPSAAVPWERFPHLERSGTNPPSCSGDNTRDAPVGRRTHQPFPGLDGDRDRPLPIPSSTFSFAAELLPFDYPYADAVLLVLTGERHRQIRRHQVSLAHPVLLLTTIDVVHADLKKNLLAQIWKPQCASRDDIPRSVEAACTN